MPVEVGCDWCGKKIKRCPSLVRDTHNFCSRECHKKWQSENEGGKDHPNYQGKQITKECELCGKDFSIPEAWDRKSNRRFCSSKCYHEWTKKEGIFSGENHPSWKGGKVKVKCDWCGEKIKKKPSHIRDRNFCSQDCLGKWMSENRTGENNFVWKGGYEPYYGSNWKRQRRKALERDEHTCQVCGTEEDGRKHDVHHIVPFRELGLENYEEANSLDNLITLCRTCHGRADAGKISKKRLRDVAKA